MLVRLQNEIGTLRELELELVKRFLCGFLVNLKTRGGVWHQYLLPCIRAFSAAWQLSHGGERREAIRKRMPDRLYASRADKTSLAPGAPPAQSRTPAQTPPVRAAGPFSWPPIHPLALQSIDRSFHEISAARNLISSQSQPLAADRQSECE